MARIQSSQLAASGTSISRAFGSNVTAGSTIVVLIASVYWSQGTPANVGTVSDNQGNTYSVIYGGDMPNSANLGHYIAYATNVAAGATTVTVALTTSGTTPSLSLVISEHSGLAAGSAYDVGAFEQGANSSSTTLNLGPTATTNQADEVVFIGGLHSSATTPNATHSGFTSEGFFAGSTNIPFVAASKYITSVGAQSGSIVWASSVAFRYGFIFTLKLAQPVKYRYPPSIS
jgi:hypothetical protein